MTSNYSLVVVTAEELEEWRIRMDNVAGLAQCCMKNKTSLASAIDGAEDIKRDILDSMPEVLKRALREIDDMIDQLKIVERFG